MIDELGSLETEIINLSWQKQGPNNLAGFDHVQETSLSWPRMAVP